MAICQSKLIEPDEAVHYRQMLEEAKLLVLGESMCKAFFRRVESTESSRSNRLSFKIAGRRPFTVLLLTLLCPDSHKAIRYNTEDLFVGVVTEDVPTSSNGHPVLRNGSFIATNFLPHNSARGDSLLIRITGNDPSVPIGDNTPLGKTLNAFSHFSFVHTGGCHLLVDYQGMCFLHGLSIK
jgi:hypothetical protein